MSSGTEGVGFRLRRKTPPHGVLPYITQTAQKLLLRRNLALVETASPHIEIALQAKGKAALNELHCFFQRYIRRGSNQSVEMLRHDNEGVQEKLPLSAVVENGLLKQSSRGRNLKEAAALRSHRGNEIRPSFLRCGAHQKSIQEKPVAKATLILNLCSGA